MYSYCMFMYLHRAICHSSATLTEVFPYFFLSCKANTRVKPVKTVRGPHCSKLLCCCTYCLFCVVLCIVCVYMCTVLLPPGGCPIAVKYIISYQRLEFGCLIILVVMSFVVFMLLLYYKSIFHVTSKNSLSRDADGV